MDYIGAITGNKPSSVALFKPAMKPDYSAAMSVYTKDMFLNGVKYASKHTCYM